MKLNDEELNMIAGGSEAESAELGRFLVARFPEFFPNPENIELEEIADCLRAKVPGFRSLTEPGDERTNTYALHNSWEPMTHAELMAYLRKTLG